MLSLGTASRPSVPDFIDDGALHDPRVMPPTLIRPGSVWTPEELISLTVWVAVGAILTLLAYRLVRRMPWPRPFRLWFTLAHMGLALAFGLTWLVLTGVIEALAIRSPEQDRGWVVFVGAFVYAVVAGVSYAAEATARASKAEAAEAQAQLAALRAQLHPHFLFNALHAVVQLIPIDPDRAIEAAELVASLLRTTIEEDRDEVTLGDEWAFVSRYLDVEQMRFGDRLRVRADVDPSLLDVRLPAFALHTLVENAVRHGAAPRVEPTELLVTTAGTASDLTLAVRNTGDPVSSGALAAGTGTGLTRLRERLAVLYGNAGSLTTGGHADGGFEAVLVVPRRREDA